MIEFNVNQNSTNINASIKIAGCPAALKPKIIATIKEYWDLLCEDGMQRPIQGYTFQVETGASPLVCCKPPQYGPHDKKVLNKLIGKIEVNGSI